VRALPPFLAPRWLVVAFALYGCEIRTQGEALIAGIVGGIAIAAFVAGISEAVWMIVRHVRNGEDGR